ncbi:MAG TPA: 5'-3'-deoxyribonucleotidase [Xanthomonadaceae bacterium]|nr:5'-3'-deoxyribonucleotidase [Xanthomonadaceae bacterium]
MLILIDQDGVLADFERGFHTAWQAIGPRHGHPPLPLEERRSFHVRDDYPPHLEEAVVSVYTAPGFYRALPPVPGAVEAMAELLDLGHDVRICTSPLNQYRYCVPEKYEWVEAHLGPAFVQRMVVTKDKTLVVGDVLVDDKPDVTGACQPAWRHVLYDQPYNRHRPGARITWADWRAVLLAAGPR